MNLFLPQLEITDDEGFTPEKDILRRESFGRQLAKEVANSQGNLVIGLDAKWGQGKTTFVKMWHGLLKSDDYKMTCILFDAFENDYTDDAFLVLTGELYNAFTPQQKKIKAEFKDLAVTTAKVLAKTATSIGLKALSAGAVDLHGLEKHADEIRQNIQDETDSYIEKRFESFRKDREAIKNFKEHLSVMAPKLGNGKPVVIIIDELDRCRPDFALDILEKIKHFFSIPNIVFVLAMNQAQMLSFVLHRYGIETSAAEYLQKFIHLWVTLPPTQDAQSNVAYLERTIDKMGLILNAPEYELFVELAKIYDLSLREIERVLTNYAVLENSGVRNKWTGRTRLLGVYLSIIKVTHYYAYTGLRNCTITYEQLARETKLDRLKRNPKLDIPEDNSLCYQLRFCIEPHNKDLSPPDKHERLYPLRNEWGVRAHIEALELFERTR